MNRFTCPVCGARLDSPPYSHGVATNAICDCCGTEFGLDDAKVLEEGVGVYEGLRRVWISRGHHWTHADSRPADWDWRQQITWLENRSAELADWFDMAVLRKYPLSDGESTDGPFMVRDGRVGVAIRQDSLRAYLLPEVRPTEYLVVDRRSESKWVDDGWIVSRPLGVPEGSSTPASIAVGDSEIVELLAKRVRGRLSHLTVAPSDVARALDELDALLNRPSELARDLSSATDPFGTDWMLGLAGMVGEMIAQRIGGECRLASEAIGLDLTLSLRGTWGRVYPLQRLHKRLAYGQMWSLSAYGIALGSIPVPGGAVLLRRS